MAVKRREIELDTELAPAEKTVLVQLDLERRAEKKHAPMPVAPNISEQERRLAMQGLGAKRLVRERSGGGFGLTMGGIVDATLFEQGILR